MTTVLENAVTVVATTAALIVLLLMALAPALTALADRAPRATHR